MQQAPADLEQVLREELRGPLKAHVDVELPPQDHGVEDHGGTALLDEQRRQKNSWSGVLPAGLTEHTLPVGMFVTDDRANEAAMWVDVPEETREEVLSTTWAQWIENHLRDKIHQEVVEGVLASSRHRYELELKRERERFEERLVREQERWAIRLGVTPGPPGPEAMEVVATQVEEKFRKYRETCDEVVADVKRETTEELIHMKATLLSAQREVQETSEKLREVEAALERERARVHVLETDMDNAIRRALAPHLQEKEKLKAELENAGAKVAEDLRRAWSSLGTTRWLESFETTERQLAAKVAHIETGADWQFSEAQLVEEFRLAVGRGMRTSEELRLFVQNAVGSTNRGQSELSRAGKDEDKLDSALTLEQRQRNRHFSKCATLATHCCLELLQAELLSALKRLMDARAGRPATLGSIAEGTAALVPRRVVGLEKEEELVGLAKYRRRREEALAKANNAVPV